MSKALLVEGDSDLANTLSQSLLDEGYEVEVTNNSEDASYRLQNNSYDIIIIELCFLGESGLDVLKDFRSAGGTTPVCLASTLFACRDSLNFPLDIPVISAQYIQRQETHT